MRSLFPSQHFIQTGDIDIMFEKDDMPSKKRYLLDALKEMETDSICGFDKDYNIIEKLTLIVGYYQPMKITKYTQFSRLYSVKKYYEAYPLCPRCELPIDNDYQCYCSNCGQRLAWGDFAHMTLKEQLG